MQVLLAQAGVLVPGQLHVYFSPMVVKSALTPLRDFSLTQLEQFFITLDEKPFRARQVFQWMWRKRVTTFEAMTNVSKGLIARLRELATLDSTRILHVSHSPATETRKFLLEMADGQTVETVLIPEETRVTVCLSSQVGCALDCDFCATGKMGLRRNLTSGEIADQLRQAMTISERPVTHIVFMGMGEPFHNYEYVLQAAEVIHSELGFGIGARRITISTSGLIPRIRRFANEGWRFKMAVSLNATLDKQRTSLMPINKKWNLAALVKACQYYIAKTHTRLTFEYVLMAGINDTLADARRLAKIGNEVFCKVNVIPYNATGGRFQRPAAKAIEAFLGELNRHAKFPLTVRWSRGDDIAAACGQLATRQLNAAVQ